MRLPLTARARALRTARLGFTLFSLGVLAACSSSGSNGSHDGDTGNGAAAGSATAGASPGSAGASSGEGGRAGSGGTNSGGKNSPSAGSASVAGNATAGSGEPGGGSSQGGSDPGEDGAQEYGFTLRKPGEKNLDWLCTFNDGAKSGHVYVRLLQTGTKSTGLAMTPVYDVERAQLALNGDVTALANARYDYGGGHHNDALSFDYAGKTHSYYHSSFGFGFRRCQEMDCRNVYTLGTTTLETEGCTSARSLPEVCVSIAPDGTHAPLVDQFMKCAGDAR